MNLVPVAFSTPTVRIWSSCLDPVPPIFILLGPAAFTAVEVLLGVLVGRLGVHPQHELVERHHRHRRHVAPVEGHARGHGRGEQVGQRDDDLVRVALGALHFEEALGTGAARLVHDDQRLLHQLVLDDDALDQACHLVGAAAGTRGHHELDGFRRLPGRLRRRCEREHRRAEQGCKSIAEFWKSGFHGVVSFMNFPSPRIGSRSAAETSNCH